MRQLTYLFLALFLLACGGAGTGENEIPEDLDAQRAMLKEKRAELNELTRLVTDLESRVEAADPTTRPAVLVTVQPVAKGAFNAYIKVQGNVEADDLFDVTAEIGGRILQMRAEEGDAVQRGQLIAILDDEQIEKQIAELETSLSLATTVYERQKGLWDQNIGSEIQFLEAKSNKERLEKNLELLKIQRKKAKVYAPATGVVDRVVLKSGELAAPGVPIIQILNTQKLKVTADVPERYLGTVKKGDKLKIIFPALAEEQTAMVTLIGRTIDPANRTFKIELDINSKDNRIKPNLLAEVSLRNYEQENAVMIPLDQLQQEVDGTEFVFVADSTAEGTIARKVVVKTGQAYGGQIIITEGLQGGEQLVIDGARGLAEETPLKITDNPKTPNNG